jgi:hypothetical protein
MTPPTTPTSRQLVEKESTRNVMAALYAVIEQKGWFFALYSGPASHFFQTPAADGPLWAAHNPKPPALPWPSDTLDTEGV